MSNNELKRFTKKNGGAEIFDGMQVLRTRTEISLLIRQLTGKKQALVGLSFGFGSHFENYVPVLEISFKISAKFPMQRNKEITGKY